jgi:hypothetical protein
MLRLILLFGLAGPLFGSITFWFGVFLFSTNSPPASLPVESPGVAVIGALLMGIWGYPILGMFFGGVPAAITGVGYWYLLKLKTQKNLNALARVLVGALLGLFIGSAYGLIFLLRGKEQDTLWMIVAFWAVPGFVAGSLCALFVDDRFYRRLFPSRCAETQT